MDEKPLATKTLFIDHSIERLQSERDNRWTERLLVRVGRLIPFRIAFRLPLGRISVERQLAARKTFPVHEWASLNADFDLVKSVCRLISEEMEWPNANFCPSDPLKLVLLHGYYDMALASLQVKLDRQFHTAVASDLAELLSKDANLGELFNLILAQSNPPATHR